MQCDFDFILLYMNFAASEEFLELVKSAILAALEGLGLIHLLSKNIF